MLSGLPSVVHSLRAMADHLERQIDPDGKKAKVIYDVHLDDLSGKPRGQA